ncbi:hypothetical protein SH501x_001588 [Pirellulaceae bacterium SH501]
MLVLIPLSLLYVLFQYGCTSSSPDVQPQATETATIEKHKNQTYPPLPAKKKIEPHNSVAIEKEEDERTKTEREASEKLAEQEKQRMLEVERQTKEAQEKERARLYRLQIIRRSPPEQTMIQCATYLSDYFPDLSFHASNARNAWQQAVFDGNLMAMRQHYFELQQLLGQDFLGYYWDIHDIMQDERKIKKILEQSAAARRVRTQ